MITILLAAGYATRLYPLTKNQPKPLLPIQDKPIIEHILDDVAEIPGMEGIVVVSNHKFIDHFEQWKRNYPCSIPISLVDDGTTSNDHRLGAIRDIQLAIAQHNIATDVLVLAGDNVYDFSLQGSVSSFEGAGYDTIMVHREDEVAKLQKTGVAEVDASGFVVSFAEKPLVPKGVHAVPPFYMYREDTLPLFDQYLNEGNNPDAPGNFIAWLCQRRRVKAYPMPGRRYDIGDMASYEEAKTHFGR